jgi:hypothetical protein
MQLRKVINCSLEWGNVHELILPDGTYYILIHYITPTIERWHRNRLSVTETVRSAGGMTPYCVDSQNAE